MVPPPATLPSLSQAVPMALLRVPYDQLTKEEKFCKICRHYLEVDSYGTTAPFWDISKDNDESHNFKKFIWQFTCFLEGEVARNTSILIHGLWPVICGIVGIWKEHD